VKHYTPEQIQDLPLPELRLAVAERLHFSYHDESGMPNIMPDWTSDLNACSKLTEYAGERGFLFTVANVRESPKEFRSVFYDSNKYGGGPTAHTMRGATEAEARTRAWLAAMQEQEETNE
jgi:hypothetical protein